MPHIVIQHCCNDASCVAACPVNCIHPTPDEPNYSTAEMLHIDPDSCVDCGECVPACPVDAIVADYELNDSHRPYLDINARYFAAPGRKAYSAAPYRPHKTRLAVRESGPLRVAIVGSGPAGAYAAEELLNRGDVRAEVSLFERLPTPWGLVRFGVAPDHQATKAVTALFERTAGRDDLYFYLNVDVGRDITYTELLAHHHAVIYAVGADADRHIGVEGEQLPGNYSAAEFVGWYNGHPDYVDRAPDLSGRRAVIVGNGNVALDVARILLTPRQALEVTDIADHALQVLAESRIDEVVVLGRRGPAQAAFTTPELLALVDRPDFDVLVKPDDLPAISAAADTDARAAVLSELPRHSPRSSGRRMVLQFLSSPVKVLGDDRVRGLTIARNELILDANNSLTAQPTTETVDVECGIVLRSVGYRGTRLPGLPFDDGFGVVPNEHGRVIDPISGTAIAGTYVAGWIKRGPSGVIGTNRQCSADTVHALLGDFSAGRLVAPVHGGDRLRDLLAARCPDAVGYAGWQAIDRHERAAGGGQRPRVKLTTTAQMLSVVERATGEHTDATNPIGSR